MDISINFKSAEIKKYRGIKFLILEEKGRGAVRIYRAKDLRSIGASRDFSSMMKYIDDDIERGVL